MLKIFYNVRNDFIEKNVQTQTLNVLDILGLHKYNIYTELSQLKGETIDMAYIDYNEVLLSHLGEYRIAKISIIVKNDDDIVVPKNFTKYSSDLMMLKTGKYYNVILNNKNYKTDNEIVMIGEDNVLQDMVRNIYTLFGNVITNTYGKYDMADIDRHITSLNIPNSGNIYYNVFTMLEGLKRCTIKKYVYKVRTDEYFTLLAPITLYLQENDKVVMTNAFVHKTTQIKFGLSDHLLAGRYDRMMYMYTNAMGILNDRVRELRKKLRLEYTPEQILVLGNIKDNLDFIGTKEDTYVRKVMGQYFMVIPIDELGHYRIPVGKKNILVSGKQMNRELYNTVCEIKTINEL